MTSTITDVRDLVRFVLARLDEDGSEQMRLRHQATTSRGATGAERAPQRWQLEIAAKRRMLASLQQLVVLRDLPSEQPVRLEALVMLRALALPYREHHDYRSEWHISSR